MSSERSASPPDLERLFRPVPTGRMSEVIIDQVKEAIRDGAFKPGDRLPPERDLAERFNVSRMTIRDGLRVLETAGLVEIRVGAHGGAFVTKPGSGLVSEGLTDMLIMSSVSAAEITEARMIIELEAVRLACQRATDEDVDALAEICDRAETAAARSGFSPEYSAEFHSRLARAAHNQVVSIVVEALHDPVVRSVAKAHHAKRAPRGRPRPDPYAEAQLKDHRLLVEAVRARDATRAREIMTIHLRRTADQLGIAMETRP